MKAIILCCIFLLHHFIISAQHIERIKLNVHKDHLNARSLLPVRKKDISEGAYRNIPSDMVKHVVTKFDIDRIQAAYEQYVIEDRDIISWNNFVKEREIEKITVFPKKLTNSSIGVFSGLDSEKNKIIIWDINGNNNFDDDEIFSIPFALLQDTVLTLEIPVQYFEDGIVMDTVVQLGFLPYQKYRLGGDTMDPDLGLTAFNRANLIGSYEGDEFDYRFVIVPSLINNRHKGNLSKGAYYTLITHKKDGTPIRRSIQLFENSVHFDKSDWKVSDYTGKELIFERLAISPIGYRTGQTFQGAPPIVDYNSEVSFEKFPKDKYVLINFWGTWCKPCIDEIPNLVKFWKENKDKIYLISVLYDNESQIEKARQIIEENGMDWVHVWDNMKDSKWAKPMGITAYPGFIFIGKDKTILSSDEGGDIFKLVEETINNDKW